MRGSKGLSLGIPPYLFVLAWASPHGFRDLYVTASTFRPTGKRAASGVSGGDATLQHHNLFSKGRILLMSLSWRIVKQNDRRRFT